MRPLFLLLLAACSPETPEPLSDCYMEQGDPVELLGGASIEGDTLSVPVSYTGGCQVHDLVVCWPAQNYSKSSPAQVALEVWHAGYGDSCEAIIEDVATVSLRSLGAGMGDLDVRIGGELLSYDRYATPEEAPPSEP